MTMPHGAPQDLADPADDRPLTYNDAGTVYRTSLTATRDRYAELSDRNLSARNGGPSCASAASSTRPTSAFRPAVGSCAPTPTRTGR